MTTEFEDIITKDFLEDALKRKIDRFLITNGTKVGDNYSSTMYAIEVHFLSHQNENGKPEDNITEVVHLISKCFPNNPSRQEMLVSMNSSYKELSFYKTYLPELLEMQDCLEMKEIIKPTYPPLVAGYAINFDEGNTIPGKVYKPFDNYIIMVDIRKTFGYRLFDRLKSFDRAHVSLVMNAMAKNHALSWAYKQKHKISDITEKFPFVENDFSNKYFEDMFTDMMTKNGGAIYEIVKFHLGQNAPEVQGTKKFLDAANAMLNISYGVGHTHKEYEKVMRLMPNDCKEDEIQWKTVIQGDCWGNNMLFRYNELSGEPEDVIFVDLQVVREGCPTTDLAYMFFSSTDTELRKCHLTEMLDLYAEKFLHYCKLLKTEPLPGFCVKELKRRFHRSKLFGFCIAHLLGLPIFLIESEIDPEDVEFVEEGKGVADMLTSLHSNNTKNDSILKTRSVDLVQELYNDGLI